MTANPQAVDTTSIFNQYQAALNEYLEYVQECIDGTTAAQIQNQLANIDQEISKENLESVFDGVFSGGAE